MRSHQQIAHLHTPDLAFTLAFAVLVVTTFVVSIALVDCCVVRLRHANDGHPFRPPRAAAAAAVLLLQPPRSLLLPVPTE